MAGAVETGPAGISAMFVGMLSPMRFDLHPVRLYVRALAGAGLAAGMAATGALSQAQLPDSFFANRPAFSRPEQPAKPATCDDIAAQLPESVPRDSRVDMAIAGPVTLIQTDGALWYVAVCADPGVRVLCVTYSANELKLGDKVVLRGGYSRQNPRHVLLDPCLASPE